MKSVAVVPSKTRISVRTARRSGPGDWGTPLDQASALSGASPTLR